MNDFPQPEQAALNWLDPSAKCIPRYLEGHKEDTFLVLIDRGRGAGVEYDTMLGKHIALRIQVMGTSLHLPRVVLMARIIHPVNMLQEVYDGTTARRLL